MKGLVLLDYSDGEGERKERQEQRKNSSSDGKNVEQLTRSYGTKHHQVRKDNVKTTQCSDVLCTQRHIVLEGLKVCVTCVDECSVQVSKNNSRVGNQNLIVLR